MARKKDTDDAANGFRQMMVDANDINVLLLGETGVGKSTFINAFTNYLHYKSLQEAEKGNVKCLVPAKFEITGDKDGRFVKKIISIGEDLNENTNIVSAATQAARSYVFPLPDYNSRRLRLIDTPGICDDRGVEQDKSNLENTLSYIGKIKKLHAICILLRPNNARLTVTFQYCITQLLSRLEKSAGDNIVFVFTNSRGTFYMPGDSSAAVVRILDLIAQNPPHVKIRFEKENVFCLDNESFRYLAALKQNVNLPNKRSFIDSWEYSVKECHRLIKYVIGEGATKIMPHQVNKTISLNKVRQVIIELSKPLADITEIIDSNVHVLQKYQKILQIHNLSIETLKSQLSTTSHNKPSAHMHIYYKTNTVDDTVEGFGIKAQIADREAAVEQMKKAIQVLEQKRNENEAEKKTIMKAMADLAYFLEHNAISPFNDSYKTYIEYLIKRESSRGPDYCVQTVQNLERLLKQYDEEKKIFEVALKTSTSVQNVTPDMILRQIQELYALPKTGQIIRVLHNSQKQGEAPPHRNTEFVLPKCNPHASVTSEGKVTGLNNCGKNEEKGANQRRRDDGKMNVHKENTFKWAPQNQFGKEQLQNDNCKREFQNYLSNYQRQNHQINPQGNWGQHAGFQHYQGSQNIQHLPPYHPNCYQGNPLNYRNPQFNMGYNNPPPPYFMNYQNNPPNINQYPSQWNQDPRQQSFPGYNPQYQPSQGSYETRQSPPQNNSRPQHQQQQHNKNYDKFFENKLDASEEYDELYGDKKEYRKTVNKTKDYSSKDSNNDNKSNTGFESFHKRKEQDKQRVNYEDLEDDDNHDDMSSQISGSFFSAMKNIFK